MENVSESSNLPSNPSVVSENVQEEMRSDKKKNRSTMIAFCLCYTTNI